MNRRNDTWQRFLLAGGIGGGFGIAWFVIASAIVCGLRESTPQPQATRVPDPVRLVLDRDREVCWSGSWPPHTVFGEATDSYPRERLTADFLELPGPPSSRRFRWFRQGDHNDPWERPLRCCGPRCDCLAEWSENIASQLFDWDNSESIIYPDIWKSEHFLWRMECFHDYRFRDYVARKWYLVPDERVEGAAYFEIWDHAITDREEDVGLIGYIGRNGFVKERPASADCFLLPASRLGFDSAALAPVGDGSADICYLLSGNQVVEVKFLGHRIVRHDVDRPQGGIVAVWVGSAGPSVRVIWESPETTRPQTIRLMHASDGDDELELLVLRTKDEIVVMDLTGAESARFTIPEVIRQKTFWFCLLDDTKAATVDRHQLNGEPSQACRLFRLDSEAGVEQEESVMRERRRRVPTSSWADAITLPSPAVFAHFALWGRAQAFADLGECPAYQTALAVVFSDGRLALLSVSLLGVALASVCYRRQRRYGLPWTWFWVSFVFLFGLPGWVGYRFHRRWPPMLPCPSCGKAAPRDREACCRCGQDFPSPAPKGTEIFA